MRETNWCHAAVGKFNGVFTPRDQEYTTVCNKTARRIYATFILDEVTCKRCLAQIKKENWYCQEHGFISDNNVEYDETCSLCGADVSN